jgi:hypothetical protein
LIRELKEEEPSIIIHTAARFVSGMAKAPKLQLAIMQYVAVLLQCRTPDSSELAASLADERRRGDSERRGGNALDFLFNNITSKYDPYRCKRGQRRRVATTGLAKGDFRKKWWSAQED